MKSRDINVCSLEGNLASDCSPKPIGDSVLAKFRLCVSNGEKPTTYLDCEWWNPNGAVEYLKKGKRVFITGRILQNDWVDSETGLKRQKLFVNVRDLELRPSIKREDQPSEDPVLTGGDIKDVPF